MRFSARSSPFCLFRSLHCSTRRDVCGQRVCTYRVGKRLAVGAAVWNLREPAATYPLRVAKAAHVHGTCEPDTPALLLAVRTHHHTHERQDRGTVKIVDQRLAHHRRRRAARAREASTWPTAGGDYELRPEDRHIADEGVLGADIALLVGLDESLSLIHI